MSGNSPEVSVIMPAFNRADTIGRAVASVVTQTFQDWELIVVDDGSTDGTASHVPGGDDRIRVLRQDNQGITGARNTGLHASRGRLIAFLDSDDEWLPHHLELCTAFLRSFPDQHFVSTEVLEDFGSGPTLLHFQVEVSTWYPKEARLIGSGALDLPAGEHDDYMRVYEARHDIGDWGAAILQRAGQPAARVYTGSIFRHLRWGYLMAMQATVLTRNALDRIGPFDSHYSNVSDFGFMASLCRAYRANYLATPTCIKHELSSAGSAMTQDHLATGHGAVTAAQDMLSWFETFFWNENPADRELRALRAMRLLILASLCFERGRRAEALAYARRSWEHHPRLLEPRILWTYMRTMPDTALSRRIWRQVARADGAVRGLIRGELSPAQFFRKAGRSLRGVPSRR